MRYRVRPDGTLTDPKLLYDATADPRPGDPDGMKVDVEGNIYSAGPGGVWIFSPEGKPLGTIVMPERVSNVAWAGPDRKTLYITASTASIASTQNRRRASRPKQVSGASRESRCSQCFAVAYSE